VLNLFNAIGVFSYVLPFLLIFAVVFAILDKGNILNNNRAINTIVSAAIGLLALQFDMVPVFFANIFPKFGVFLAVVLVVLLFLGFVGFKNDGSNKGIKAVGIIAAVVVFLWAMSDFWWFGGYGGNFWWWFNDYFWSLIVLGIIVGAVIWIGKSGSTK
jgi:peptidoglycan/LPS O-acetylase OafA/YrhL